MVVTMCNIKNQFFFKENQYLKGLEIQVVKKWTPSIIILTLFLKGLLQKIRLVIRMTRILVNGLVWSFISVGQVIIHFTFSGKHQNKYYHKLSW